MANGGRTLGRAASGRALAKQALARRAFRRSGAEDCPEFFRCAFRHPRRQGGSTAGETISQAAPERCLNLAGQTSLLEMIEWLRLCELVVTTTPGGARGRGAPQTDDLAFRPDGAAAHRTLRPTPARYPASTAMRACMRSRCAWPQPMACSRRFLPWRWPPGSAANF